MQDKNKTDWEFKINGVQIKSNTIYEVKSKYDADAPSGFKKHNTSKILSKGVSEMSPIPFNEDRQLWDTGLEENSPRYINWKPEDTRTLVNVLKTAIVEPFEKTRKEGILKGNEDSKFWSDYLVDIYAGRIFNTKNEKDALDLYLAVSNYMVTEKDNKENKKPESIKAKYDIVNREFAVSFKEERMSNKVDAIGNFYTLLNTDKDKLLNILEWLELNDNRDVSDKTLTSIVMRFLDNPDTNIAQEFVKKFKDTVAKANTEKGEQEIQNVVDLNKLKRNKVLNYEYKEYWLGEISVGSKMKDGAIKAISDKELQAAIRNAVEKLESIKKAV